MSVHSAAPKFRPNFAYLCINVSDPESLDLVEKVGSALRAKGYVLSTTPVEGLSRPEISIGQTRRAGKEKIDELVASVNPPPPAPAPA